MFLSIYLNIRMKNLKLSQRQKNIIRMLPSKDAEPITIQHIARRLDLSSRTVQRDLVAIESFLEENYFEFIKRPGIGLIMNETKEELDYLYELLDMVDSHKRFDRDKRVNFVLSRLLSSNQAIKYQAFTSYLNISEKTLVDDLFTIEEWLDSYHIKLIRKRGEGITIEGAENSIRKAQAELIYQNLNEDSRLELLRDINEQAKLDFINKNNIMNMIDRQIIDKTRAALNEAFNSLNISISDQSYIGLVVHISLAIERLKLEEEIEIHPTIKQDLQTTQEYLYAEKIVGFLERQFELEIPATEISYIAMHIKGANIVAKGQEMPNMDDILQAHFISKTLINEMESIFHLNLNQDKRLEDDLIAHLSPALTRLKHNLNIRNPILEDIKENYADIYHHLSVIVPNVLLKYGNLKNKLAIPEDEIGYIAIHFISSIESKILERTKVNVLTICPTGYGTSRLLATYLSNNIKNIKITGNASIMDLNNDYLEANKVDLVISTVNIAKIINIDEELSKYIIEVSPIVSDEDILLINRKINRISREKYYEEHAAKQINTEKAYSSEEHILNFNHNYNLKYVEQMYDVSISLNNLYKNIRFFKINADDKLEESVAKVISESEDEFKIIKEALIERNKISSTFFEEYNLHLLHARSSIKNPKLAFGKILNKNELVIVMLTSNNTHESITNLFGKLSSAIIDMPEFIDMIEKFEIEGINKLVHRKILKIIKLEMTKGENNES